MHGPPEIVGNPAALFLTETAVSRNGSDQVDRLSIDPALGDAAGIGFELNVDPSDPLHGLISDALEHDLGAPYLRSVRYSRAVDAIAQRGCAQAASLDRLFGEHASAVGAAGALNLIGSAALFDQMWEAVHFEGDEMPFSIEKPVVRVVAGANPYPARHAVHGLRVNVITARLNWSTDISPQQIAGPLRDLQDDWESFGIGVTTPAYPNQIEADILPVPSLDDPGDGAPILHIDAHGALLSHEQLMRRYGACRADFVAESWGIEIMPYSGLKSFILINGLSPDGELAEIPVSGEELAGLCRQAGVPLVVLNACQAASEAAEGGIAADLVKAGVPDVIAFRHMVTTGSATIFVSALYRALVRGASAAQACCFARGALYRCGVMAVPEDAFPFPDWISLVHYSARPVVPEAMPAAIADIELDYSLPGLPVPLEWALLKLQDLLYQIRLSRIVPDAPDLPSPRPIILFGPIGTGAETLLWEAARWLANTDLQISGFTLFDVGGGLGPALEPYFPDFDPLWPDEQIVALITERWGPPQAMGFFNLDFALDRGAIDAQAFQRILRLAAMLAERVEVCLVHSSRDLFVKRFADALRVDVHAFNCWPVAVEAVEDWLLSDAEVLDDPKDRMVTTLLAWISEGHVDVARITRACSSPEQREILLDHFVFGTPVLNPPHELWILHQQVQARWAMARREADIDPLLPLVAGLASGIFTNELADVGRPLRDQAFPRIPRMSFDEILPLQHALLENGLLSEYTGRAPPGWSQANGPRYAVMKLNPFLRPLARMNLAPDLKDELDRWLVAWAIDKIGYFSNDWLVPAKRSAIKIFIDHAWSLFAVAIWIARRDAEQAGRLRTAIDRAWSIGWWPRDLDLGTLFGVVPAQPEEPSEYDRLWKRAVNLQMQGDKAEARNLLFLAIASVGGETGGYPYYAAQYRLGTISLDMGDTDQAAEHLRIAEEGATYDFVTPDTHAHIIYEQGLLDRRSGREARALERFKASIGRALELGLYNLLCLNYQELTDMELRHVPIMILDGRSAADRDAEWSNHVAQAEIYLNAAREAAAQLAEPTPEEGTLLLLEARILAARSKSSEARTTALEAMDSYRRWEDHRISAVRNFLHILDAAFDAGHEAPE